MIWSLFDNALFFLSRKGSLNVESRLKDGLHFDVEQIILFSAFLVSEEKTCGIFQRLRIIKIIYD